MLLCMQKLKNSYNEMARIQKTLTAEKEKREKARKKVDEKSFPLSNYKTRLVNAFFNIAMVANEAKRFTDCSKNTAPVTIRAVLPVLKKQAEELDTLDACLVFIDTMQSLLKPFHDEDGYEWYCEYSYDYDWRDDHANDSGEGLDMDQTVLQLFRQAIDTTRKFTVLDTYARCGVNLLSFKGDDSKAELYALSEKRCIDPMDKPKFERTAIGPLKGSIISNGTFDVALLNPNITLSVKVKGSVYEKIERDYIQKTTIYLRSGGLLLLGLPYYRFHQEICSFLAKNYEDIHVFKGPDFERSDNIYIVGIKRPLIERELDEKVYARLRNLVWADDTIPQLSSFDSSALPNKSLALPKEYRHVDFFRGSKLDEEEIFELYKGSKSTEEFWEDQKPEDEAGQKKRPLLPFSIGHLGLVMTSGCLDGIVEEEDGHKHAIKGRVIKRVDRASDVEESSHQVEVTETTSNRVEINAFLADGTYKCLA